MSYPIKYRERTIEYRKEGHTLEETHQTFNIQSRYLNDTGMGKTTEGRREFRKETPASQLQKINPEKLTAYIAEHPDAYQKEIAEEFGCSATAIYLAMKRLKITRKKRQRGTRNRIRKK